MLRFLFKNKFKETEEKIPYFNKTLEENSV